jgi:hypothetical protein
MELIVIGMAKPNEFGFPSGGFSLTLYYPFRESLTHQTPNPKYTYGGHPKEDLQIEKQSHRSEAANQTA